MKKFVFAAMIALSATAFAQDTDLVLEGERWLAEHTTFVCEDGNTKALEVPTQFQSYDVQFNRLTTDYSLSNILVKANFTENGVACRYSAFLLGDKALWTVKLVDSKAYSANAAADCEAGKAVIDEALAFNEYKYLHGRAAIYVKADNAQAACGSDRIGVHFQARGIIKK